MKIKSLKFKSVNSTNDIALDLIKKNKLKVGEQWGKNGFLKKETCI